MKTKYHNVSLHEDLIKQIDNHIKNSKLSFRSRAEFLTYAVRKIFDKEKKK